jgi:hypothetical protein
MLENTRHIVEVNGKSMRNATVSSWKVKTARLSQVNLLIDEIPAKCAADPKAC